MKGVIALVSGVLFAIGLTVSGMTMPSKVIGFLDILGEWDPSLGAVMAGAIGVFAPVWLWARKRKAVLTGLRPRDTRRDVDGKLFVGAGLFGIGWGMGGLCPGPALVNVGSPVMHGLLFVGAMIVGMLISNAMTARPKSVIDEIAAEAESKT
ncbi:MAG: DUF6691 family protein [Planctomycetota bacterium]|jgi:uncharacterized membrane protein YedE/YeeE